MKKRILSIAFVFVLVFSLVPFSALALENTDFVLKGGTVAVDGTEDKTVNVVFEAEKAVTVIALQGTFTDESDYLTLSDKVSPITLSGTNYFDTASGTVVYADAALEGYAVAANGNVMTAVYTVDKNTPTGTYEVNFSLVSVQDYDFNKVNDRIYTATISVTNNSTSDPEPIEGYTVSLTADNNANAVKIGDVVNVKVSVDKPVNGIQGTVAYDSRLFETSDEVAIDKWLDTAATDIVTLTFTAKAAGTGVFSFEGSVFAGDYEDFVKGDAVAAYIKTATVTVSDETAPKYDVEIDSVEGATVKADKESAVEGDEVTITVEPVGGRKVSSVTVEDSAGNTVEVNDKNDGTYTFKMPAGKVTVTVTLVPVYKVTVSEYVTGVTLILVDGEWANGYTYGGNAMFYMAQYDAYAWVVDGNVTKDTAIAAITEATSGTPVTISAGYDVNNTRKVDFNDAGAAFGCYNKAYVVAENVAMYLRADVDGDKGVDMTDVSFIMNNYSNN